MELIRTYINENNKKYGVYKIQCPKCGGAGYVREISWLMTDGAGMCFKCHGAGYFTKEQRILTEKEKAQRERAKLRKEEKKEQERLATLEKIQNEKQDKINQFAEKNGIKNHTIYVLCERNYNISEIKEDGFVWWGHDLNIKTEPSTKYETIPVNINDVWICGYYKSEVDKIRIIEIRNEHMKNNSTSKHIGILNEKIELNVTLNRICGYSTQYGYNYIYIMSDCDKNQITWRTTKCIDTEEGQTFTIKGTIKAHTKYDNVLQTELTRCKILN